MSGLSAGRKPAQLGAASRTAVRDELLARPLVAMPGSVAMNGIHDMGGLHGFGDVVVEADEPVFHTRWESRVFGIAQSQRGNIDAGRHSLERLDPVAYLQNGYFGRWLAAMERTLVALGIVAPGEIEQRMRARRRSRRRTPAAPRVAWRPIAKPYTRAIDAAPAFAAGQRVRARNHQPAGHTRLPAYARGRAGVVMRQHPAMVFPDDNAHHRGENPQYLYTVRFAARELWGDDAESGTCVHVDLFESYLEAA
jgi:nitrile hydratase